MNEYVYCSYSLHVGISIVYRTLFINMTVAQSQNHMVITTSRTNEQQCIRLLGSAELLLWGVRSRSKSVSNFEFVQRKSSGF